MEFRNLSLKCMVNKKVCRSISERLYVAWVVLSRHCVKLVAGMQQHLQIYHTCDLNKFIPRVRDTVQSVDMHLSK